MPWKSEIDRLVNRVIVDASKGGENEATRVVRTLDDLLDLAPERAESHFHLGTADEIVPTAAQEFEASEGEGARWRFLGRLEAAARRGERERVYEFMDDALFTETLPSEAGRVALRAVGRMLLRDGEEERAFQAYKTHLDAVDDEGSRRDAAFLLEEALRRADRAARSEEGEEGALARLERAAEFVGEAGLDARSGAKVDRKMGRLHQLGERWDDAAGCYQRALDRLPTEDPYRSVLVGDLALATLGVRGTLDLLPEDEREGRDEAIRILSDEGSEGEGRSYNAIYTLGMLHYETGNHEDALTCFREADQLMRENRAKARIVHARSRFFGGHCALQLGAEDDELDTARKAITRDAGPANLDPDIKEAIFDALLEVDPDARLPGRRGRSRRGGRGRREDRPEPMGGPEFLAKAREALDADPIKALEFVDRAFKSRPDFDTWFGAYVTRLEGLIALNERKEALRTYERFRAKLYQRGVFDRLEGLLTDGESPIASLFDDESRNRELVELYEVMPERESQFVDAAIACAQTCIESGEAERVARALCMLREAAEHDADAAKEALTAAEAAATEAGIDTETPSPDAAKSKVDEAEERPHILLVGGDEGRRPHLDAFNDLAKRVGFDGDWIFTGSRPPHKTLQEIEDTAEQTSAILLHHGTGTDIRGEVLKMAAEMEIPVREAPWLGRSLIASEVLRTLDVALIADAEAIAAEKAEGGASE
ncbi:MAG: hypothetical protein QNJ98_05330 [Planctomycetota bacterium]|nr:hypothetical protein [Planctomycetota bacterium]